MINYFTVPGLGGSGAEHWQTWFEKTQQHITRIEQHNWDSPDIDQWVENLEEVISAYQPDSVVLAAHSLGCLTVAEWARRYRKKIKGALLVAPPDVDVVRKELHILTNHNPITPINFPTIVVSSTNDPWAAINTAEDYAQKWGSKFINIGQAGHINAASGHYSWQQGLDLLYSI